MPSTSSKLDEEDDDEPAATCLVVAFLGFIVLVEAAMICFAIWRMAGMDR